MFICTSIFLDLFSHIVDDLAYFPTGKSTGKAESAGSTYRQIDSLFWGQGLDIHAKILGRYWEYYDGI